MGSRRASRRLGLPTEVPLPRPVRSAPETWFDESTLIGDQPDVITPALDAERLRGLADWTAVQSPWTFRGIGGLIGAVGGLAGFAADAKTRPT